MSCNVGFHVGKGYRDSRDDSSRSIRHATQYRGPSFLGKRRRRKGEHKNQDNAGG